MSIVVCVKQIKNLNAQKEYNHDGNLNNNPYDLAALSWACMMKKKYGFKINTISMGTPSSIPLIRQLFYYDVDRAILLTSPILAGSDTHATAYALCKVIENLFSDFKIIICGDKSMDGETGQVPHSMAVELGINSFSNIQDVFYKNGEFEINCNIGENNFKVEDEGRVLIAVNQGPNGNIYLPKIGNIINSKSKNIELITCESIELEQERVGDKGSFTKVVSVYNKNTKSKRKNRKIYFSEEKGKMDHLLNSIYGEKT